MHETLTIAVNDPSLLSVTSACSAKTTEQIDFLFVVETFKGPKKLCIRWGLGHHRRQHRGGSSIYSRTNYFGSPFGLAYMVYS